MDEKERYVVGFKKKTLSLSFLIFIHLIHVHYKIDYDN